MFPFCLLTVNDDGYNVGCGMVFTRYVCRSIQSTFFIDHYKTFQHVFDD